MRYVATSSRAVRSPHVRSAVQWFAMLLVLGCGTAAPLPTAATGHEEHTVHFPTGYPAFDLAVERAAANRSPNFGYSLAVASYQLLVSHGIVLNDATIAGAVSYVLKAREIAGPQVLFGNGTRVINVLHEYDSFNNLFGSAAVIRKELGLGARPENIWTYQGPSEIGPALRAIANTRGPLTIYMYAHGSGRTLRLSDRVSLQISQLAEALRLRGNDWTNVLADGCDGVVTHLPAELGRIGAEVPSYIVSSTPRGAMGRGSRLLNSLSGTGAGTGTYFMDPRRLEFEDLAETQDFVFIWIPTEAQRKQLQRAWPFRSVPIGVQADRYPAWVWELAEVRIHEATQACQTKFGHPRDRLRCATDTTSPPS